MTLPTPEGAGGFDLGIRFPRVKRSIAERPSPMRIVLPSSAGFVFRPAPSISIRRRATMPLTREEIVSVLGPTDETLVADILSTGASFAELREAWAWLNEDEALMGEGRPLPGTRVAELIELLDADEDD
ncbi:hypothetical protein [Aminobacter sp. Piv2-1]|uniref:hypothetical protein n=1 Tax=Aminobacter sp. Piv2-1 TaxID=3031122 RepID=UPI0030ECE9AE